MSRSPEPRDQDHPCHVRVLDLPPGGWHGFDTGDSEWILLPLSGSCTVAVRGRTFRLTGRRSVFAGATDFVYTPRDVHVALATRGGGRFVLAGARCDRQLPARYRPASAAPLELHDSGPYRRHLTGDAGTEALACHRLVAAEVLMPGGNGSFFPPHEHAAGDRGENRPEEMHYVEITGGDGLAHQPVFPSRDGDIVLVHAGLHEPSAVTPARDAYCLNVMADSGAERAGLCRERPDHTGVRNSWDGRPINPRLPLSTALDSRRDRA